MNRDTSEQTTSAQEPLLDSEVKIKHHASQVFDIPSNTY